MFVIADQSNNPPAIVTYQRPVFVGNQR